MDANACRGRDLGDLQGSGRDVFSPSESSTIADEPKNPMSTSPPSLSSADSSICRGLPAIVLSEVKRPCPSDVPPPAESRRIAATTSSFTSVGRSTVRALSPNATMPTRIVLGCRSANAVAAALAASMRVGSRSRPACCWTRRRRGSPCLLVAVVPGSSSAGRARRRRVRAPTRTARTGRAVASAAHAGTPSSARALRLRGGRRGESLSHEPHVCEHQDRDEREAEQHPGRAERHQPRRRFRDSTMPTKAVTRSSAVETSQMSTPARRVAARSSASRCSPASLSRDRKSSSLESTTSCSPVSASSTTTSPASGSSYSRGSTSRIATTSCRSLSRSRGRSHPGAVMKSETRTTRERRRIVRAPSRAASSGRSPLRPPRAVAVGGFSSARAPGCGCCAAAVFPRARCRRGSPRPGCRSS